MNYTTAICLVSDKVRGIGCSYEDKQKPPFYLFKTFDETIQVGDLVVVPTGTRHGMTVVKVEEVDKDLPLEDTGVEYKWIVGKVDVAAYEELLEHESLMIEKIKKAEKRRRRDELRTSLMKDMEEEFKALPFYDPIEKEGEKK